MLQGPPPGFGPAAQPSNGNTPPGFPSHSGSDSSDYQGHIWSVSQAAPQQWASFHPSHSSPNAAGSDHSTHGLHQSHSAGLAGYPCHTFAMPGLSDLQNLREQSGSDHSLFSGSSNQPGFAQSQFRQRSRFQFAQDPPMGDGSLADGPTSPSIYSSLMSPAVQQRGGQHDHNHAQLQHDHQRHQSGHQLFPPSGPGFASASLFASSPGGASVPRQPGMHSVAGNQGDGFVHAAACVMDHSGHLLTQMPKPVLMNRLSNGFMAWQDWVAFHLQTIFVLHDAALFLLTTCCNCRAYSQMHVPVGMLYTHGCRS